MSNAYVTLGQGRKSIFKHRGIIFRECGLLVLEHTAKAACSGEKYFFKWCNLAHSGVSSDIIMT